MRHLVSRSVLFLHQTIAGRESTIRSTIAASVPASATRIALIRFVGSTGSPGPHDPPLEWQLNPDVTVRTKGVMEKCSFCIQRIVEAKIKAKRENRIVRDGEFAPACVQTCPTDALIFGNLKDPESRVANLVRLSRAYQVLGDLNTKPE